VALARLVLRAASFDLAQGGVQAAAFLVDMNEVFEDFVAVALREALGLAERVFPQGARGRWLRLDEAGAVGLKPDLSWWEGSSCTFVGDAKYRRVSAAGVENADLYQLLAYAVAADLPGGLLVYAAGEGAPVTHQVVHVGKRLEVTMLDLGGSPEGILTQVHRLARQVRGLHQKATARRRGP
jgi:5-methylcytosine-specific restriction enzyme subunit McrC